MMSVARDWDKIKRRAVERSEYVLIVDARGSVKVGRADGLIEDHRRYWRAQVRGRIRVPRTYPYRVRMPRHIRELGE